MELTKQDIISLIGVIKTTYLNCYKDATKEDLNAMADTWHDILKDYPKNVVGMALKKCLQICKFAPTLADIMEQITLIANAGKPTENDYWTEIEKAVEKAQRIFYFGLVPYFTQDGMVSPIKKAEELFESLSPIVREYLGHWQTLKSLSELETLEFEKNRFMKMLPNLKSRVEIKQTINQQVIENADILKLENTKLQINNTKV